MFILLLIFVNHDLCRHLLGVCGRRSHCQTQPPLPQSHSPGAGPTALAPFLPPLPPLFPLPLLSSSSSLPLPSLFPFSTSSSSFDAIIGLAVCRDVRPVNRFSVCLCFDGYIPGLESAEAPKAHLEDNPSLSVLRES